MTCYLISRQIIRNDLAEQLEEKSIEIIYIYLIRLQAVQTVSGPGHSTHLRDGTARGTRSLDASDGKALVGSNFTSLRNAVSSSIGYILFQC
jgi:hypothetical protein